MIVGWVHKEIAMAYAEEGANVVLVARTADDIQSVSDAVKALRSRSLAVPTDVREEQQVTHAVQRAIQEFGRLDILVNAARGSFKPLFCPIREVGRDKQQIIVDVNLTGVFLCIKSAVPHMIRQGSGSLINISSWVAQMGSRPTGFGGYAVSKSGVEGLTHLAAAELEPFNISVNALRPRGPVATSGLMNLSRPCHFLCPGLP